MKRNSAGGPLARALGPGLVLIGCLPAALMAQAPASLRPVDPDHWSYDFLELAQAMGWDGAWQPWQAPVVASSLGDALRGPDAGADEAGPEPGVRRRWSDLFGREMGLSRVGGSDPPVLLGGTLGYEDSDATIVGDRGTFWSAWGEAWAAPWLTVWAEGGTRKDGDEARIQSGGVALRFDGVQVVAGRMRLALGHAQERVLLNGRRAFDGLAVGSSRPVRIPGLGFLGPVSGQLFVGSDLPTPPSDNFLEGMEAWFLTSLLRFEPHPRLQVGLQRTARFAGSEVDPVDLGDVLGTVFLTNQSDFSDDGQGAVSLRLRLDPFGFRLSPYLTIGFEDTEALWEDPGLVAGLLAPFRIREALLALRYEYVGFGKRGFWCRFCDYQFHAWFVHPAYGPYQTDGVPLGSLLGGYGSAHRVQLQLWSSSMPLRFDVQLFRQSREFVNLLVSRWPGVRRGGRIGIAGRPRPGWELEASAILTDTEVGRENGVRISLRILDIFSAFRR